MIARALSCLTLLALLAVACVPLRGGWDVDALTLRQPALARIAGQRLGDMIPFPVLEPDGIGLVACRFGDGEIVRVVGEGADWPSDWSTAGVRAMDERLAAIRLERADAQPARSSAGPLVEARTVVGDDDRGPSGLGDTLTECDVSPISERDASPRGVLTRAEVRMQRGGRNEIGHFVEATPEEWVGAFMHELGHAVGFSGHVAAGRSVLVRDQHRLRSIGRAALAGQSQPDPTLTALYALAPGTSLGRVEPSQQAARSIEQLERIIAARSHQGDGVRLVVASVGDEEARLSWRFDQSEPLGLRFPRWRRDLAEGRSVDAIADRAARRAIRELVSD